jgi:predicted small metal-binding protein
MAELACDCGFIAEGASEEDLVTNVQTHADTHHGFDMPVDVAVQLVRGIRVRR